MIVRTIFAGIMFGVLPLTGSSELRFGAQEIDSDIAIGYGVAVADVDGDGKPDILLADKRQFVWYRNPGWEKFLLAENLTPDDNVCLAAEDIDGDGKAEVAVGAGWNPGDTVTSGALFFLEAPPDRTQRWKAVRLEHEPTVHRMRWIQDNESKWHLAVLPLHGRGNENGQGQGVKFLAYEPTGAGGGSARLIDDSLHVTHNFDRLRSKNVVGHELLVAAREGVFHLLSKEQTWDKHALADEGTSGFSGASEVRAGRARNGARFVVTVEPFHGNELVLYTSEHAEVQRLSRRVLDDTLREGHALACGDLLGSGADQVVVGWRNKNAAGHTGIKCFIPGERLQDRWTSVEIDGNAMACEDLCLADLNGDGKLDIVASGRATRNVKVYINESGKTR